MKLNFKAILFAAVAAFMAASCAEGTLELQRPGLENVDATKVELTTVVSSDAARVRPFYVYELTLSSGDGSVVLDAKFVSDGQPLHGAVYSPAEFATAHKNSYLTGADGTTLTVNGVTGQVVAGDIKVTAESGAYTVSGVVQVSVPAADGGQATTAYYDLTWAAEPVAVKFAELPTLTKLTKVQSATSNVASGTKSVTVQLASEDGSQFLAVDFYSEDGYLAAGTYKASAEGGVIKAGEFGIGWDPGDIFNIGYAFTDWGTCWWTVADGVATAQKILSGEIYVAYDAKTKEYTIDIDNGTQYAQFVGKIPALTVPDPVKPGGFDGTLLTTVLTATPQAQYNQVVLQIGTDGVSATMDPATWQTTYSGTGTIFNLTIHAEADANGGTYIPTGKYDAADGTTDPFTWQVTGGNEWMTWGSYVIEVADGTPATTPLTEGTVWVGAKDGQYIINIEVGDTKYRYTGPINGLSTPADDNGGYEGGDEGGDAFDGVSFSTLLGSTPQSQYNQVVLQVATDGVTATMDPATWQTTYSGTGTILNLTIHAEVGDTSFELPVGEYAASDSTMEPNTWQITGGNEWMTWGSYLVEVVDGEPTIVPLTDGTVTVEEGYTITLDTGDMKYRYTGPITL